MLQVSMLLPAAWHGWGRALT